MVDLIGDLKQRARLLQRRVRNQDEEALARVRVLPELREMSSGTLAAEVKRRHCLAALAHALGFSGWPHGKAVLSGALIADLGTLMHVETGGSYWNIWSASYDEASHIRREHGGFLLPYRRQFFIAEGHYLDALGLAADDPDWERIGRDWARPADRAAWSRLTAGAIEARLER